jgi:O-antigen ligase
VHFGLKTANLNWSVIASRANALARNGVAVRPAAQAAPTPPAAAATQDAAELNNPVRFLGLAAGLCLVLVRFGMLHELIKFVLHVSPLLTYVFGLPALLGLVASGGIPRAFRGKIAYYWTAYALWMLLAVPFSTWRGGSAHMVLSYMRSDFIVLFVIAGLAITWRECKMMLRAVACGGVILLVAAKLFRNARYEDRFGLAFGTVANPNDYACVLLLVLPFLLWLGLSSRWIVVRLAMFAAIAVGLYLVLSTASRGAALGLAAEILFFLFRGTARQRIGLLTLGGVVLALAVGALPIVVTERIQNFSTEQTNMPDEAVDSLQMRRELLRLGIKYTIQHPVFGVGPGQGTNYEGGHHVVFRGHGYWADAHNTFLQVASECGIPAAVFFIGGLVATYRRLSATHRKARRAPDCADIRMAVLCIMTGMVGFCVAITFLNFAYLFYAPALGGLAAAVSAAAEREFEKRGTTAQVRQAAPFGAPA